MAQSVHRSVCRNLKTAVGGLATGTATPTITTGLNSITGAIAVIYGASSTACQAVQCATSGGTLTVRRYKLNGVSTTTFAASTTAGTIMWIAYGT